MSNTVTQDRDIKKARLLNLFPMASLRDFWPNLKKRRKPDLIKSVVAESDDALLIRFIKLYFDSCKHHTIAFKYSGQFPVTNLPDLPDAKRIDEEADASEQRLLYLSTRRAIAILGDPFESFEFEFYRPVQLVISESHVLVRLVTMEKDIKAQLPNREVISSKWEKTEDRYVDEIFHSLIDHGLYLNHADLHKGLVTLMDNDRVDATVVRYKKDNSISSEEMDSGKFFKRDYPEEYKLATKSPIPKALCTLTNGNSTVDRFQIEPLDGKIRFPRTTPNPGDALNVVKLILEHNK